MIFLFLKFILLMLLKFTDITTMLRIVNGQFWSLLMWIKTISFTTWYCYKTCLKPNTGYCLSVDVRERETINEDKPKTSCLFYMVKTGLHFHFFQRLTGFEPKLWADKILTWGLYYKTLRTPFLRKRRKITEKFLKQYHITFSVKEETFPLLPRLIFSLIYGEMVTEKIYP